MATATLKLPDKAKRSASSISAVRLLADQTFSRVAGAPLIGGNDLRLLKDAQENYPAWLEAIESAKELIFFETYIIRNDSEGKRFAEALIKKAQEGVQVYLIYDWAGGFLKTSKRFWNHLRKGGVNVRCFNPPKLASPMAWLSRDHRKALVVDNRIAFVSGLCVGCAWSGDAAKGIEPWRDTGVEIRGPAVLEVARSFTRAWQSTGDPLPEEALNIFDDPIQEEGSVNLRVIATEPETAGMFRLDQLVSAIARLRLYLSDAYFAGTTAYVQALVSAAKDGVDVRLLVPGTSDISIISPLSRVGYRPLLEGGVRIYEWNGPMMHSKTAVADAKWARIGSTNLNLMSWTGNWELDIAVEDEKFAKQMEETFLEDLSGATEIVLKERRVVRQPIDPQQFRPRRRGSAGRVMAGALTIGRAIDAAVSNRRDFSRTEAQALLTASFVFLGIALLLYFYPKIIVIPVAFLLVWTGLALGIRAVRLLRKKHTADTEASTLPPEDPASVV
jgi:cardiolipin synthase A/B